MLGESKMAAASTAIFAKAKTKTDRQNHKNLKTGSAAWREFSTDQDSQVLAWSDLWLAAILIHGDVYQGLVNYFAD